MRFSLALVGPLLLVGLLGAASPAAAHDWLNEWRSPRAEYRAEFERARMLERLDCAGLTAYVAEQNWRMNQWIYAEYHRPLPRPAVVSSSVGLGASPGSVAPPRP
jgi:hypothetical protein